MSPPLRVLFLAHNHPEQSPGGAEIYGHALFRSLVASGEIDGLFLAHQMSRSDRPVSGTPFRSVADDEMLWSLPDYDDFWMTTRRKDQYTRHLDRLLRCFRPEVVHIQHVANLGWDVIRAVRNALPKTQIVMTLHEFLPICYVRGHMRRSDGSLCERATPERCHSCFPHITPGRFLMRERLIKTHLDLVDIFLLPSRFLAQRYIEWGLPESRLRVNELGQEPFRLPPDWSSKTPAPDAFAFFGQVRPHKGLPVLLRAFQEVIERQPMANLWIHGSGLEDEASEFADEVEEQLEYCQGRALLGSRYQRSDLPVLLRDVAWIVVPSVWWENAPLVIQEAFLLGRPVICSDIGGMAEKVTHGLDGLHFRAGNARDLAHTLSTAITTDGLWRTLQEGIRPPRTLDDDAADHLRTYRQLIRKAA